MFAAWSTTVSSQAVLNNDIKYSNYNETEQNGVMVQSQAYAK